MPQVGPCTIGEIEAALGRYEALVNASALAKDSKINYYTFAREFVRWLKDDFVPGAHVRRPRDSD